MSQRAPFGWRTWRRWTWRAVFCLLVSTAPVVVPVRGEAAQSDLDALMEQVLARRDENWKKRDQYVLEEREESVLTGPGGVRLWGQRFDYTWYIRDGFFVRSPLRANGGAVSERDRRQYEADFLRRAKARDARAAAARQGGDSPQGSVEEAPTRELSGVDAVLAQTRQPQFVDAAYFLRFTFEPGRYALVGRELLEGRTLLRVEYYPQRLFSREQDQQRRRRSEGRVDRNEDVEAARERALNTVSIVTLWVDPASRQIVKYVFDNVDFDFLPGALLLRADHVTAVMTMGEPFAGVWLPRMVTMTLRLTTAAGPVQLQYELAYHDYRVAESSGRFFVPGDPR